MAIIEPRQTHYYQPGWTLVGAGVFRRAQTERSMTRIMPRAVTWIRAAVAGFEPEQNEVVLEDGERVGYRALVVAPGIELHWDGVEGLRETLGKNGITSKALIEFRGDGGASHDQSRDEGAEESFAPAPGVVHELEEAEIQRQLLLRDTPVWPQPGT